MSLVGTRPSQGTHVTNRFGQHAFIAVEPAIHRTQIIHGAVGAVRLVEASRWIEHRDGGFGPIGDAESRRPDAAQGPRSPRDVARLTGDERRVLVEHRQSRVSVGRGATVAVGASHLYVLPLPGVHVRDAGAAGDLVIAHLVAIGAEQTGGSVHVMLRVEGSAAFVIRRRLSVFMATEALGNPNLLSTLSAARNERS